MVNNLEESIKLYEKMIKRDPNDSSSLATLGVLYVDIDLGKAKEYLDRAIKLDSKKPIVLVSMGSYYSHTGDLKEAKKYFEKACKIKRGFFTLCEYANFLINQAKKDYLEGDSKNQKKNLEYALSCIDEAITYEPNNNTITIVLTTREKVLNILKNIK